MLEIRKGFFETNSSSCHALLIPKDQDIQIRKTLDLNEDSMHCQYIRDFIACCNDEQCIELVNLLYLSGVETIKYSGRNRYFSKCIEQEKANPRDLGISKNGCMYNAWSKQDVLNFIFGTFNEYNENDNYLKDYEYNNAIYW